MKLAWFSPLPPSTSGIAAYSAELLPLLEAGDYVIDTFTETNARDFVWKHRRAPYDLTVFQMGNAACHDYMWAYVFRYPGVVVLHDAQLHQARALWLTKRWKPRRDDYLAELHANHPEAPADLGELVAAGLGGSLYQHWPLIRLVVEAARLTIVHNKRLADDLRERYPRARFEHVEMGIKDPLQGRAARHFPAGAPPGNTIVVAAFGGITPEKRLGPLIRAISAMADRHPQLHLMLVGGHAEHYDVVAEARRWGIADRLRMTGYVPDSELADHLFAADICACLRWPTNRETSASWLRCLAAGRATIITDLAHLGDVPSLDPRGWRVLAPALAEGPVCVSIDILDEEHSLQLALERLVTDSELRHTLGRAAREWWATHHQLKTMADAYDRVLREAAHTDPPPVTLPRHLVTDGSTRAESIIAEFDVGDRLQDVLGSSST